VKELVTEIAKTLVDNPGEVTVREVAGAMLRKRTSQIDPGSTIATSPRVE